MTSRRGSRRAPLFVVYSHELTIGVADRYELVECVYNRSVRQSVSHNSDQVEPEVKRVLEMHDVRLHMKQVIPKM